MSLDGKAQRNAVTAVEQALRAVAAGERTRAVDAARRAAELDQIGTFAGLPAAVDAAFDESDRVTPAGWDAIAGAVGPGPLAFLVTEARAG